MLAQVNNLLRRRSYVPWKLLLHANSIAFVPLQAVVLAWTAVCNAASTPLANAQGLASERPPRTHVTEGARCCEADRSAKTTQALATCHLAKVLPFQPAMDKFQAFGKNIRSVHIARAWT